MGDRELLELAVKAAGIKVATSRDDVIWIDVPSLMEDGRSQLIIWNPLTDDGQALRLAVKLHLEVFVHENDTRAINGNLIQASQDHESCSYSATRRAIVRAAAEIGKAL